MCAETEARRSLALGSVGDAREALGHRAVSSRELVELLLRRIDGIDHSVNAIVELRAEEALEEAEGADRAIAAGGAEPLLGVPVRSRKLSTSPACTRPGATRSSRITSPAGTRRPSHA
jgi:hypothetical protein